jgi:hypothetical protein
LPERRIDESSFFMMATRRGICEDVIALKFICQFAAPVRQEIISLEMATTVIKASEAQNTFFKKVRPFQPLVGFSASPAETQKRKDRYNAIGTQTNLKMIKDKLPPVEQMAANVGLSELYNFFLPRYI